MKTAPFIFAFFLLCLPTWLLAQEVITNREGRKVVKDSDGQWRYFQGQDSIPTDSLGENLHLPVINLEENEFRVAESKQMERELAYTLIKHRVQLVGYQIAILENPKELPKNNQELLEQTEGQIRKLEAAFHLAELQTDFLQQISNLPEPIYSRKLEEWRKEHPLSPRRIFPISKNGEQTIRATANGIANGTLILPPKVPCRMGEKIMDPTTNDARWQTASDLIFSHTDALLESQFLKRDFIQCAGSLASLKGGLKLFNLELAVSSTNAQQIFGVLPKDEFIELQLIGGEKLSLFNTLPSNGQWISAQDAFVYRGSFLLGFREEKLLRKIELDQVTIRWSKVQEQYEIYETDFFIRQFQCLDDLVSKDNNK